MGRPGTARLAHEAQEIRTWHQLQHDRIEPPARGLAYRRGASIGVMQLGPSLADLGVGNER
jgi:hypothetical protein